MSAINTGAEFPTALEEAVPSRLTRTVLCLRLLPSVIRDVIDPEFWETVEPSDRTQRKAAGLLLPHLEKTFPGTAAKTRKVYDLH